MVTVFTVCVVLVSSVCVAQGCQLTIASVCVYVYVCRGNLIKTPEGKLAFIDFGNVCDISEEERYGLFGLVIGLQNKDLPLVTENLLKVSMGDRCITATERSVRT
jgi:hypothetical protein